MTGRQGWIFQCQGGLESGKSQRQPVALVFSAHIQFVPVAGTCPSNALNRSIGAHARDECFRKKHRGTVKQIQADSSRFKQALRP